MQIIQEKLFNYLHRHVSDYSVDEIDYITENFYEAFETQLGPDILIQILSALDLYKEDKNIYLALLKLLKKYFTLDKNIIEIGEGHYPAFSTLIDKEQTELGKGRVTSYDEKLISAKIGNIDLNKRNFTNESLKPYDLVVGVFPCEASELIIRKSNEQKKPFFLATCGCVHLPPQEIYNYRRNALGFHRYLEDLAYETLDDDAQIKIEYLEGTKGLFETQNPIFIKTYNNKLR